MAISTSYEKHDQVVSSAHDIDVDRDRRIGNTDALKIERERTQDSLRPSPSCSTKPRMHAVHVLNTPGH